jgi:hypothetical protein
MASSFLRMSKRAVADVQVAVAISGIGKNIEHFIWY